MKGDALDRHLLDAAVDQPFVHFEVGDAVAQQSANAVALLEYDHRVAGACELLRASEACGAGADDGDSLAGSPRRHYELDPPLLPPPIDDRALDGFDRDRIVVNVERTRRFTGRGAHTAGEFREIIGRMQRLERRPPLVAVDEVVPVRDQIVDRAALVAERNAAIHTARRLLAVRAIGHRLDELLPAAAANFRLVVAPILALDFEKAGRPTHGSPHRGRPVPMLGWVPAFAGMTKRTTASFGGFRAGRQLFGLQFEKGAAIILRRDFHK